jgi:hypothetical protein
MENYVAAVFGTRERAIAFHAALLHPHDGLHVNRAGVYGRGEDGDVCLQDTKTDLEGVLDFSNVFGGAQEEALDELNEKLPDGSYALLAHVSESDPTVLDALAQQYGGKVYRRSSASLETAGYHRFIDSSSL